MRIAEGKRFWMAWNLVPGLGRKAVWACRRFLPILREWWGSGGSGKVPSGLLSDLLRSLRNQEIEAALEKEWEAVDRIGCRVMTLDDPDYPHLLREIHDPPPVLYLFGELRQEDELSIAVVGSRSPTPYGRQVARWISGDLARAGLTVVSGLARGADLEAHRGALEAGGRTLAVLGSGLAQVYPREHRTLCESIARQGAVLSPFPLDHPPLGKNFPARNRILSGLSLGTVVVQAAERSGSLITARLALEQGRELFAIPGRITSPMSVGTNYLIKTGAKLVQSAADILEELSPAVRGRLQPIPEKNCEGEQEALSSEEEVILSRLSPDDPVHIDALAEKVALGTSSLLSHLLTLEMRQRVVQLPGQHYILRM